MWRFFLVGGYDLDFFFTSFIFKIGMNRSFEREFEGNMYDGIENRGAESNWNEQLLAMESGLTAGLTERTGRSMEQLGNELSIGYRLGNGK